jgi:hypothetical protein
MRLQRAYRMLRKPIVDVCVTVEEGRAGRVELVLEGFVVGFEGQ